MNITLIGRRGQTEVIVVGKDAKKANEAFNLLMSPPARKVKMIKAKVAKKKGGK